MAPYIMPRNWGVTGSKSFHKQPVYHAKDFIATAEGLIFAVVADGVEDGRVRCFLRYVLTDKQWRKVATDDANRLLAGHFSEYLFHSGQFDAKLHGVLESAIVQHYAPRRQLQHLLQGEAADPVIADLQQLCELLRHDGVDFKHIGITGSLLVGHQKHSSDIDLVCYDRNVFHALRNRVQSLISQNKCGDLHDDDWLESFRRRSCDLTLDEYVWHEQRKYNKALINRRKFDLSLVAPPRDAGEKCFHKVGAIRIQTHVTDDFYGFDYPAEFAIDHPDISSVVCFTATYSGQAQDGERIVVAGQLEEDERGTQRIVVGSSREAVGEYIKVVR